MRVLEVEYQPDALSDLEDIYQFVVRLSGSAAVAERFVGRIIDQCDRIGELPFMGTARDDLRPGLRTVGFERRAVIAYTIEPECVRITNVFYGGRDYEALYRDPKE